ncbi:hypothetical protein JAAARDRAFT_184692 [Jaapia argillacea MUCL 33604]|uniref:Fungal lipase-type domain-containing protein n=1 Tax=Jaapia argillacea MUCL 33604 TaxID=933084 RepID=A0A067PAB2_9AGAM|nr:hypothetical protein JAAARDRAFT_184692 [Jaapia argillacea MUCL 33604]
MFIYFLLSYFLLLQSLLLPRTLARPTLGKIKLPHANLSPPQSLSLSAIQSNLIRPAEYSQIAYCESASVLTWTCGKPCENVKGIEVLQVGGGRLTTPRFIAYDTIYQTVVLAHRGTDPDNILSIANDIKFSLEPLKSTWFPNADEQIRVHDGFQQAFLQNASTILYGVNKAIEEKQAREVVITGHSLGAAIAMFDALLLRQHLDGSIKINAVVFGLPRVGNSHWADLVDSTLGTNFVHITNRHDPVPTVPPYFLGYVHPSQELHITGLDQAGETTMVLCPGRENNHCSDGTSLLASSVKDHLGPYFQNVTFGNSHCN